MFKRDDTVYVVSGFMRSGTSMMMKALEAGGLKAVYAKSRDKFKARFADDLYDPNGGGLYELERKDYQRPDFPRKYKGKLIKCLGLGVSRMRVMPKIKVVFMRRDVEEIKQSYMAFFGKPLLQDPTQTIQTAIELARNRKDTELIEMWYRDVVEHPREMFAILKANGWPIDVEKAASIVDKKQLRFKKEWLEKGVV